MDNSSSQADQVQRHSVLILSDGKPGHVNQSIAFARLLDLDYVVRRVSYHSALCKALSYLADRLNILLWSLFSVEGDLPERSLVVSAGSATYYPNRVIARYTGAKSVAIMLPRGYRYNFDLIVAQQHDQPPKQDNILTIPVNLSCPEPQGLVKRRENSTCVSIIIGGPSRHFRMDVALIEKQIQQIYELFPDAEFLITTSRRTPQEIEELLESHPARFKVIASRDNINPIADFLAVSDYVFVTEDSTSMISEAVCYGQANVEILPLTLNAQDNKIQRMTEYLENEGYVHIFDGYFGNAHRKFNLKTELKKAWP